MIMKLIIMGPPGVGKGTQAKILSLKLNILHLSTGEILRNEINSFIDYFENPSACITGYNHTKNVIRVLEDY